VGIGVVPDERIDRLADALSSRERIPATVGFSDVAGLVRGAGSGEGLGGEFLGYLRATDALAHVVRTFPDEDVFHVEGRIDPVADAETVDLELLLADQALVERRRERLERAARVGEKGAREELGLLDALAGHLNDGEPARTFGGEVPDGLDLLTVKPVIYVANVSEAGDAEAVAALGAYAAERGSEVVPVAARFEAELAEIDDPEEREAFLRELGLEEPGMPRLARAAYRVLGLISFFTAGPKETRAWTVRRGATAVEAAGKIHSDIARGFIRAEVIGWQDLVACGSSAEARKRGLERVEGRDYVVQDGDVINVRFNV
jgi:GTP-binding protein YchF